MVENKLIGLYGGAFDPIHNAHLSIARNCIKVVGLEKVIRLEMLNKIKINNFFEISDFEIKAYINHKKVSYTLNTLKYFKENNESTLIFIIGKDAFSSINKWYRWDEILRYCHLVLVDRSPIKLNTNKISTEVQLFLNDNLTTDINDLKKYNQGKIYSIQMPNFEESSSQIRYGLNKDLDIKKLIPEAIHNYILHNKLYNSSGHNK